MTWLAPPDAGRLFRPDASLAESFARGAAVYVGLLVLFRLSLRRQAGSVGVPDVLLVVLVSECVSSALGAAGRSVANGLAAVAAVMAFDYAADYAAWRWPAARRWLEPDPLPLVVDGRPIARNPARERIGRDELRAVLRQNGVDDGRNVKRATVAADGPGGDPPDLAAAVCLPAEAAAVEAALARHHPGKPGHPAAAAPHPAADGRRRSAVGPAARPYRTWSSANR